MEPGTIPQIQHQDHQEWLKEVDFYLEQIGIFQVELELVASQSLEYLSNLEHVEEYRSILLKKTGTLNEIKEQITLHEKVIAEQISVNKTTIWDHLEVKKRLTDFVNEFDEFKKSFRKFVAHQVKIK